MLILNRSKGDFHKVDFSKIIDYIKKGDVVCFNDSTIINNMFICKTKRNRLIKIVLEGFLPENRVIISGLLKEKFDAHEVLYLADNFDWTALYIHPGYQLKVVDCLLTNLHQPKTTHMVLTGQFAGVDLLMKAYTSKDIQSCQFDMFGDCMLIIRTTD